MDKLNIVISETLNIPSELINDNMAIGNTAQWDSLSHMALIVGLEDAFEIQFTGDDIAEMRSITTIRDMLEKYCAV